MKLLLLLVIASLLASAFCTQPAQMEDSWISYTTVEKMTTSLLSAESGYFENLRQQFFGVQRSAWNGLINGFNDWKDYDLTDWCMNTKYQNNYIAGLMMFTFKVITGQYINVLQIFYDAIRAYNFVTDELRNCYGKEIITAYEVFFLRTPFYLELASVGKHILTDGVLVLPNLVFFIINFIALDFKMAFTFVGRAFKDVFSHLQSF